MNRKYVIGCIIVCIICGIVILYNKYYKFKPKKIEHKSVTLTRTNTAKVPVNIENMNDFSIYFKIAPTLVDNNKKTKVWTLSSIVSNTNIQLEYKGVITAYGKFKVIFEIFEKLNNNKKLYTYSSETTNSINFNETNTFQLIVDNTDIGLFWEMFLNDENTISRRALPYLDSVRSQPSLVFKFFSGTIGSVSIDFTEQSIFVD